jgi:hypothetical protein
MDELIDALHEILAGDQKRFVIDAYEYILFFCF